MSVEWFDKEIGSDIAQGHDDPTLLLIGLGKPDYINVPMELGEEKGGRRKCLELIVKPCPLVGHNHDCVHYILEGPVHVAECKNGSGFLWYSRKD